MNSNKQSHSLVKVGRTGRKSHALSSNGKPLCVDEWLGGGHPPSGPIRNIMGKQLRDAGNGTPTCEFCRGRLGLR